MDDTFSFVAPVMPRRQVDPFALRLAVAATVAVLLIGSFATFVIDHERAADARRVALEERLVQQEQARVDALAAEAAEVDPAVTALLDAEARSSARLALGSAKELFAESSRWADAGPAQLTLAQPSFIYVDGPSTSPTVVSVDASGGRWSAAVMGPSGTCYWIATTISGPTRYGTGSLCTGLAAHAAANAGW